MPDDDHPRPFWDLDFRTLINLIKAVEEPDYDRVHPDYRTDDDRNKIRYKDAMIIDLRKTFYERLSDIQAGIDAYVLPPNQAKMTTMLVNMISSTASLAMIEYEVAATDRQQGAATAGNSAKGDRQRALVRDLVEEHRRTHAGKKPTVVQVHKALKKWCENQNPSLEAIGRVQVGRYMKDL